MAEAGVGSLGLSRSVRSLFEAVSSLEREIETVVGRATVGSAASAAIWLRRLTGLVQAGGSSEAGSVDLIRLLRLLAGGLDVPLLGKGLARALGLADEGALDTIRADVRDLMEQVAKLREREIALAGGVSQLRARAARFDEALAGLARVQGKYVARQDAHALRADDLERLTRRRDDHITRLIRDTVSQRAELERVSQQLGEARAEGVESPSPDAGLALNELIGKLQALESKVDDFRKLHKAGTQGVIDSLEGMRERIGRVEARVAEMSRESRAKGGRLDALARHVAGVESRMAMALGKGGKPVVAVASEIDKPLHAAG